MSGYCLSMYPFVFRPAFMILTFYNFTICPPYKYFSDSTQKIMVFASWIDFLNGLELFFIININSREFYLFSTCPRW
jgi:hypothetical protein